MSDLTAEDRKSVIVIGGGLAGIAAALALAKHGVSVRLLEARRKLGGRAGSFVVKDEDGRVLETVDYCQHVGMGCCTNLKQLIRWLGHEAHWQVHRELHFFGPSGRYQKLSALPFLPAPIHLAGWLAKWPDLTLRDRWSVARGVLAIRRLAPHPNLAAQSAGEWLATVGQTRGAIDKFWRTIIVSALGEELDRVDLASVAKVLQDGFLNHRDAFHLLVPNRPLDELFGDLAARQLERAGVDVQFGTKVDEVKTSGRGTVNVSAAQRRFHADRLVLAVPWHQISKVALKSTDNALQLRARQAQFLHSSPITGVHTWWDRPWLALPHAAIVGRLCQWVFPKQQAEQPPAPGLSQTGSPAAVYYQIVISASRSLPRQAADSLASLIHQDLAHVFPAVRPAKLLGCKVVTDPQAVFSVSPGALEYRADQELLDGIVMAGDWTNTGWPATMEGAVLSGFRAAEILLQSFGQAADVARGPLNDGLLKGGLLKGGLLKGGLLKDGLRSTRVLKAVRFTV